MLGSFWSYSWSFLVTSFITHFLRYPACNFQTRIDSTKNQIQSAAAKQEQRQQKWYAYVFLGCLSWFNSALAELDVKGLRNPFGKPSQCPSFAICDQSSHPTLTAMELPCHAASCFPVSHTGACRKLPGRDIKAVLISLLLKVKLKTGWRQKEIRENNSHTENWVQNRFCFHSALHLGAGRLFTSLSSRQKSPSIIFRYHEKNFPAFWPVRQCFPFSTSQNVSSKPASHRARFLQMAKKHQKQSNRKTTDMFLFFFSQKEGKTNGQNFSRRKILALLLGADIPA